MHRPASKKAPLIIQHIFAAAALSAAVLCLFTAQPAYAVKRYVSWEVAQQGCAADSRNVLTVQMLLSLAEGKGEHTVESLRLPEAMYWSSDAAAEPGKYLAVTLPGSEVEARNAGEELRYICDRGPRRSTARTWEEAEAICSNQGLQLPTTEYLQSISGETGDGSYAAKGLFMRNYWTRDMGEQGHTVVLTGNGKHSWFPDSHKFSVYCTND